MNKIVLNICILALSINSIYANLNDGNITVHSATKTDQSIEDITSDVEVITSQELEAKNISTLSDALKIIAGIDITSNGGLGQTSFVRINGMHYSNTLVLVDGVIYNDITNGSAFIEHISLVNVKQIEIIKGAQSGIWGANASGGVINIITKEAKNGFHGNLNLEYGSFNTSKGGINLGYKNSWFYTSVNFKHIKSEGFSAQKPKDTKLEQLEKDGYENNSFNVKAGIKINDTNKINIIHTQINSNFDYDSGAFGTPALQQANSKEYTQESKSQFSSINFNHIDSFNKVNIHYKRSTFNRTDPKGPTKEFAGNIQEYGIKSKIPYKDGSFVIIGYDKKDYVNTKASDVNYSNNGSFLVINDKIGNIVLTSSFRYDTYTNFKNKITGKRGVKYNFSKDIYISSNFATGYKAPSLYELSHDNGDDLKPEYTQSYNIQAKIKFLKMKYFQNNIEDLIVYDLATSTYKNGKGESIIKGYEVGLKFNIFQRIFINLNYNYFIEAKDKDDKTLLRVPQDTFKFALDYKATSKLLFSINGQYVGSRLDKDFSSSPSKDVNTGYYTVANLNVNYKINKYASVYGKINNFTNTSYQTVYGYATSPIAYYSGINLKF